MCRTAWPVMLAGILLAFLSHFSRADEPQPKPFKVESLNAATMKLGAYGPLRLTPKDAAVIVCKEVIDGESFRAKVVYVEGPDQHLIIRMPTKGFVDDQRRDELLGKVWLVKDTKKHGGKTYFVLELFAEPKK